MITFSSDNIPMPTLSLPQVERWIRAVAAQYGFAVGELNYVFCDDEKILAVNREFLQHDIIPTSSPLIIARVRA